MNDRFDYSNGNGFNTMHFNTMHFKQITFYGNSIYVSKGSELMYLRLRTVI